MRRTNKGGYRKDFVLFRTPIRQNCRFQKTVGDVIRCGIDVEICGFLSYRRVYGFEFISANPYDCGPMSGRFRFGLVNGKRFCGSDLDAR